jgi:hypothetical protein
MLRNLDFHPSGFLLWSFFRSIYPDKFPSGALPCETAVDQGFSLPRKTSNQPTPPLANSIIP